MNERIKELAQEARLLTGWPVGQIEYQKFAELIIHECMNVVGNKTCPNYAYKAIQKHFGVNNE
jgi:hypothetical protein